MIMKTNILVRIDTPFVSQRFVDKGLLGNGLSLSERARDRAILNHVNLLVVIPKQDTIKYSQEKATRNPELNGRTS